MTIHLSLVIQAFGFNNVDEISVQKVAKGTEKKGPSLLG
jgi:hypothetical protein